VATQFPAWQQKYLDALANLYDEVSPFCIGLTKKTNSVNEGELKKTVSSLGSGQEVKHAMVLIQELKRGLLQRRPDTPVSSVLDRSLIFNEFDILEKAIPYIQRSAGIAEIQIVAITIGEDGEFVTRMKDGTGAPALVPLDKAIPGQPTYAFENI
jgi:leucyl-tRNA synthetase